MWIVLANHTRIWLSSAGRWQTFKTAGAPCPVDETCRLTFEVTNDGEVPISFNLTSEPPFTLVPSSGTVQPRQAASV